MRKKSLPPTILNRYQPPLLVDEARFGHNHVEEQAGYVKGSFLHVALSACGRPQSLCGGWICTGPRLFQRVKQAPWI